MKLSLRRFTTLGLFLATSFIALGQAGSVAAETNPDPSEILIPPSLAAVEEVYVSKKSPFIFHLQIPHAHYESALKIRELIFHLQKSYGAERVLAEGVSGEFHPELLDFFDDTNLNVELAKRLGERGELTGVDLALADAWFGKEKLRGRGLEDPALYRASYESFERISQERKSVEIFFDHQGLRLDKEASKIFSKDLRKLIKHWKAFENQQYSPGRLPDLQVMAKKHLAGGFKNPLTSALEGRVETKNLVSGIEALFEALFQALAKTESQQNLLHAYKDWGLARKLMLLELTRPEWEKLSAQGGRPVKFIDREMQARAAWALNFYHTAEAREALFVAVLEEELAKEEGQNVILVTGGFHTEGVLRRLREKGLSYASLSPRLSGPSDPSLYRELVLRTSPMEKPGLLQFAPEVFKATGNRRYLPNELERVRAELARFKAKFLRRRPLYLEDRENFLLKLKRQRIAWLEASVRRPFARSA